MNNNIQNELDSLIKNNHKYRFELEYNDTEDIDRKKSLTSLLNKYETKSEQSIVDEKKKKMFDEIDRQVFRQKWSKLSEHHKEIKIREYVNDKYSKYEKKETLLNNLITLLKSGKSKIDKYVNYDNTLSTPKIVEITDIIGDNIVVSKPKKVPASKK